MMANQLRFITGRRQFKVNEIRCQIWCYYTLTTYSFLFGWQLLVAGVLVPLLFLLLSIGPQRLVHTQLVAPFQYVVVFVGGVVVVGCGFVRFDRSVLVFEGGLTIQRRICLTSRNTQNVRCRLLAAECEWCWPTSVPARLHLPSTRTRISCIFVVDEWRRVGCRQNNSFLSQLNAILNNRVTFENFTTEAALAVKSISKKIKQTLRVMFRLVDSQQNYVVDVNNNTAYFGGYEFFCDDETFILQPTSILSKIDFQRYVTNNAL